MANNLLNALEHINKIYQKSGSRKAVLFLDYDGTLTPIVSNPEKALLSGTVRSILIDLSEIINVAVISGRDRRDIQKLINIDSIFYAGSHGFDISGPNNVEMQYKEGEKVLQSLDNAEEILKKKLHGIKGSHVERKKYAIAVHYRNVEIDQVDKLQAIVAEIIQSDEKLKTGSGKKILELKPNLNWHKGKALRWLMEKLNLQIDEYMPLFIGDDITDEDALKEIQDSGVGILVGSHEQKTHAAYHLKDTTEVVEFLQKLRDRLLS